MSHHSKDLIEVPPQGGSIRRSKRHADKPIEGSNKTLVDVPEEPASPTPKAGPSGKKAKTAKAAKDVKGKKKAVAPVDPPAEAKKDEGAEEEDLSPEEIRKRAKALKRKNRFKTNPMEGKAVEWRGGEDPVLSYEESRKIRQEDAQKRCREYVPLVPTPLLPNSTHIDIGIHHPSLKSAPGTTPQEFVRLIQCIQKGSEDTYLYLAFAAGAVGIKETEVEAGDGGNAGVSGSGSGSGVEMGFGPAVMSGAAPSSIAFEGRVGPASSGFGGTLRADPTYSNPIVPAGSASIHSYLPLHNPSTTTPSSISSSSHNPPDGPSSTAANGTGSAGAGGSRKKKIVAKKGQGPRGDWDDVILKDIRGIRPLIVKVRMCTVSDGIP